MKKKETLSAYIYFIFFAKSPTYTCESSPDTSRPIALVSILTRRTNYQCIILFTPTRLLIFYLFFYFKFNSLFGNYLTKQKSDAIHITLESTTSFDVTLE